MRGIYVFAVLLLAAALASGCASVELAAIRAAQRAVEEARAAIDDPENREALAKVAIHALDDAEWHLKVAEREEAAAPFVDAETPATGDRR